MKSIIIYIMGASVQQKAIANEMQVTRRCYEGKVGQQSIQLEEYPTGCLKSSLFKQHPKTSLPLSTYEQNYELSNDRVQIVSILRWLSDGDLS